MKISILKLCLIVTVIQLVVLAHVGGDNAFKFKWDATRSTIEKIEKQKMPRYADGQYTAMGKLLGLPRITTYTFDSITNRLSEVEVLVDVESITAAQVLVMFNQVKDLISAEYDSPKSVNEIFLSDEAKFMSESGVFKSNLLYMGLISYKATWENDECSISLNVTKYGNTIIFSILAKKIT